MGVVVPARFRAGTTTPTCEYNLPGSRTTEQPQGHWLPQPATRKLTGDNLVPIMHTLTRYYARGSSNPHVNPLLRTWVL